MNLCYAEVTMATPSGPEWESFKQGMKSSYGIGRDESRYEAAMTAHADREQAARQAHASGGLFKSPKESFHHPDSQMSDVDRVMALQKSQDKQMSRMGAKPVAVQGYSDAQGGGSGSGGGNVQTGPKGGRYIQHPGGSRTYLK